MESNITFTHPGHEPINYDKLMNGLENTLARLYEWKQRITADVKRLTKKGKIDEQAWKLISDTWKEVCENIQHIERDKIIFSEYADRAIKQKYNGIVDEHKSGTFRNEYQ